MKVEASLLYNYTRDIREYPQFSTEVLDTKLIEGVEEFLRSLYINSAIHQVPIKNFDFMVDALCSTVKAVKNRFFEAEKRCSKIVAIQKRILIDSEYCKDGEDLEHIFNLAIFSIDVEKETISFAGWNNNIR